MLVQLIGMNLVNVDEVHFKIIFPFELAIALGTRKVERNPVRQFTLIAFERTFARSFVAGAVF